MSSSGSTPGSSLKYAIKTPIKKPVTLKDSPSYSARSIHDDSPSNNDHVELPPLSPTPLFIKRTNFLPVANTEEIKPVNQPKPPSRLRSDPSSSESALIQSNLDDVDFMLTEPGTSLAPGVVNPGDELTLTEIDYPSDNTFLPQEGNNDTGVDTLDPFREPRPSITQGPVHSLTPGPDSFFQSAILKFQQQKLEKEKQQRSASAPLQEDDNEEKKKGSKINNPTG